MDLGDIVLEGVDWIHPAADMDRWRVPVNTVRCNDVMIRVRVP
jgi:hypothetical protein